MDRHELRREMRARRSALAAPARLAAGLAVADVLEQLAELHVDTRVAGYWAVRGELPLHAVVAGCARRGQQLYLPVLHHEALRFAPWRPGGPVVPNDYGIPEPQVDDDVDVIEPAALELVLVPLVAFDRGGNRLGSGAGYYDRSFAFLREGERPREPLLVGIAYAFQEVAALDAQPWDVPLDFVCTDRELIDCTPPARTTPDSRPSPSRSDADHPREAPELRPSPSRSDGEG